MDNQTLKHHLLKQLIHHHEGADVETLVQKTAESAGVQPDAHRDNIIDWLNWLTVTGHIKHKGDTLAPSDLSRLQAIHDMTEIRRDLPLARLDPQLINFFWEDQNQ
jgi:hypothetical protein